MTEIANHVFGDVLTENPAVAQSAFGPHRVITDRWKGMSPQQLEDIRRQQDKQRLEKEVNLTNVTMYHYLYDLHVITLPIIHNHAIYNTVLHYLFLYTILLVLRKICLCRNIIF
jgi:hypothetical protein